MREIIHIDMDCFYAAIEIRERPELAGRPVAVGGLTGRGVLTTCNYEARKFGCRSAMPTFQARRLCPDLVLLPPRFGLYRKESGRIREILREYTQLVEPLSLDEAYLDVSDHPGAGWEIARQIRSRILETTGLTASAGIAPNKLLAKIASDWRKPDGQFAIVPDQVPSFMKRLPVGRIWGIGPKTASRLREQGVETCGQLQKWSLPEMSGGFGKNGRELYELCRGRDDRAVEPSRMRKSMSNERTFEEDLSNTDRCIEELEKLCNGLLCDLGRGTLERPVRKAFVKVKFADFRQTTKECFCREPSFEVFEKLLVEALCRSERSVRLIGTGVRFDDTESKGVEQLELPLGR